MALGGHVLNWGELGDALPSGFSPHNLNSLLVPCFFCTFVLFLVTALLKTAPTCSAELPSSIPKCKRAMTCRMKKMHVLGMLCLKMSL